MTAIAEGLPQEEAAVAELSAGLGGRIVGRDDPDYDESRKIWNGSIDRRPALIARCAGVAAVISAVRWARTNGVPTTIRSGGHSLPGLSVADDAFVIDLSMLKGVRVDPQQRTARVQAGVLLGELDKETQPFGLAAPSGIVTHTGVAGLTLGGGIGWIQRKHGLSIDKLRRGGRRPPHPPRLPGGGAGKSRPGWGVCRAGPRLRHPAPARIGPPAPWPPSPSRS